MFVPDLPKINYRPFTTHTSIIPAEKPPQIYTD